MSDGTSTLRFLELTRFQERRRLKVMDAGVPIERLNELEMVRGEIWANVWQTDYIVRISPKEGRVLGWINLKGLLGGPTAKLSSEAVLNGIAFDAQNNRIFVPESVSVRADSSQDAVSRIFNPAKRGLTHSFFAPTFFISPYIVGSSADLARDARSTRPTFDDRQFVPFRDDHHPRWCRLSQK